VPIVREEVSRQARSRHAPPKRAGAARKPTPRVWSSVENRSKVKILFELTDNVSPCTERGNPQVHGLGPIARLERSAC
jgi:hypothetical protein